MEGVKLVAANEFRMRLRTGRWKWLLVAWVIVVGAFTLILDMGLRSERSQVYIYTPGGGDLTRSTAPIGPALFGALMFFVLTLTLLVSPALTAQSINGDRERGTLAPLQATLLTPAEIAVGKLVAGWSVGLAALGLTLPFVLGAMAEGGVGVAKIVVTMLVVALLIGVVCAISQAMSALFHRTVTSSLLSYLAVAALSLGTGIAFLLGILATTGEVTHTYVDPTGGHHSFTTSETRPNEVWWLLAPNPFVVLADAAPAARPEVDPGSGLVVAGTEDPLNGLRDNVRSTRQTAEQRDCLDLGPDQCSPQPAKPGPVWPWGLGFDLAVGAGALWVTTRRLQTPATKLARGVRVA
jgi:ABC-type transport system involved in multi-copper enzyme maturation permease subunit